jgi:hypothetical protein
MLDKIRVRKFMFFALGISISLSILYFLQQWLGKGD